MISYNLITALSMAGISAISSSVNDENIDKYPESEYIEISTYSLGLLDCNMSCNGSCNASCQG